MDANPILSKLNRIAQEFAPGAILEKGSIAGPDPVVLVWVDVKLLRKLLEALRADQGLGADWVENITVAQVESTLMATYFFRSTAVSESATFALRATTLPANPDAWASLPTIRDLWPMAAPMENYVSELFGIRFVSPAGGDLVLASQLIVESEAQAMQSFPLRKNFVLSERAAPR